MSTVGSALGRLDAELRDEPARRARPGELEVALRARHPDVEEAPLLGERLRAARALERQLALLEPRQEDDLELEAFRSVVGEEVDAAARRLLAEAALEIGEEVPDGALAELLREADEAREVALAGDLLLADSCWERGRESLRLRRPADDLGDVRSAGRAA